jgi:2-polyprenyl-3-methyl-5-hydroxy-6-metoxy-1,4-benzoquinol methylase/uncharacterized protein YbaR (Trm112 family)
VSRERGGFSPERFAREVRETNNSDLALSDHHPHRGYTPAAFRHYVRRLALLDALEPLEFKTVLDVGCSEGFLTQAVAARFGAEAWGVDLSTTALAKARKRYGLALAAAEATHLPFADGAFDLVFSTEVIEHVLAPELMVAELRRVSRGTVVVTTPVSQTEHEHEPDFALQDVGHVNNFDSATVRTLFGPDAHLGSFRCNATLALIVAVGRYMPRGVRDGFYALDRHVSQRWGAPDRRLRPLRNRDWLITVSGTGKGADPPSWRCAACRGQLDEVGGSLRCADCGRHYQVNDGVPDFFEP